MLTRFAENAIITSLCDAIADRRQDAEVAELADALDSKSSVVTLRAGSSPAFGTIEDTGLAEVSARSFFA